MPYNNMHDLPEHVRNLKSEKKKRQWMMIFNSVLHQTGSESRAFAAANASLKGKKKHLSSAGVDKIINQYIKHGRTGKYEIEEG